MAFVYLVVTFIIFLVIHVWWKSILIIRKVEQTKINFIKPLHVFGNLGNFLLGKEHLSSFIGRVYKKFPQDRFVAGFEFMNPVIIIKDPELLKNIAVRHFTKFHDLPFSLDETVDSLMGRVLLFLKGSQWRDVRSSVSPMFTISKLKTMGDYIGVCAQNTVKYLENKIEKSQDGVSITEELKAISMKFGVDVVASCVYGVEVNSFVEPNNLLFRNVKKISKNKVWFVIKIVLSKTLPKLMKFFKLTLYGKQAAYFTELLHRSINLRTNGKETRLDFLNLLHSKSGLSIQDINSQAFTFVLTSFGGIPQTASFLFYSLAKDKLVQSKLRREIDDHLFQYNGRINHEEISKLKYLDMVLLESLRRWTPLPYCTRKCNENHDLGTINENSETRYEIKSGDSIWIPIEMIHMDPKNWPQPEKFDPERFSPENKPKIKPYTFIPFGAGPRNCVGSRFALIQIKIFVFYFIANFEIEPSEQTFKEPIVLKPGSLFSEPEGDFWLKIKKRSD